MLQGGTRLGSTSQSLPWSLRRTTIHSRETSPGRKLKQHENGESHQLVVQMAWSFGLPGLHMSFAWSARATSCSTRSSLSNSLNSDDESAVNNGFSIRIRSPYLRSLVAKAPHPAIVDSETAKKSFWKMTLVGHSSPGVIGCWTTSHCTWCGSELSAAGPSLPSSTVSRGLKERRLGRDGHKLLVESKGRGPWLVRHRTDLVNCKHVI